MRSYFLPLIYRSPISEIDPRSFSSITAWWLIHSLRFCYKCATHPCKNLLISIIYLGHDIRKRKIIRKEYLKNISLGKTRISYSLHLGVSSWLLSDSNSFSEDLSHQIITLPWELPLFVPSHALYLLPFLQLAKVGTQSCIHWALIICSAPQIFRWLLTY